MDIIYTDLDDAPYKIGDHVERIRGAHGKLKVGETAKVTGFKTEHGKCYRILLGGDTTYGHDPKNLKLFKAKEEINNNYEIY